MGATTPAHPAARAAAQRHAGGGVLRPHRGGHGHRPRGFAGLPGPVRSSLPTSSLGQHHQRGRERTTTCSINPYIALWPSLYIFLLLAALNLMADRLRSRFDVRAGTCEPPWRGARRSPSPTPPSSRSRCSTSRTCAPPSAPRRGLVQANDGVSFTLDRGKTLGIVGESGSGKTVLTRSIMGLLPDTNLERSGSVRFAGHELDAPDPGPAARRLGHPDGRHLPGPHDRAQPGRAGRPPDDRVAAPPPGPRPQGRPTTRPWPCSPRWASPPPSSGCGTTPTSSRAACASAS